MAHVKTFSVSCLCGASTHTFSVPASSLPFSGHLCCCNISRRISGTLVTSYVNISHQIKGELPSKPDLSALTAYRSSDILTRHFCATCGTHMYLEYKHDGHFEAAAGTLQVSSSDDIIQYKDFMWVEDTIDGGASQFITSINGKQLKRYLHGSGQSPEVPYDWKQPRHGPPSEKNSESEQPVYAHCHCNGVEFYIHPPNEKSREAQAGYPDLLISYLDIDPAIKGNPEHELWWLLHPRRFLAGTCTCTSCRRASGFDITCWAFVPICNITQDAEGTRPFTRHPYWGTMKTYNSSEGVIRSFCGTCGANVFWDGAEDRGDLVDVAVGLLDAGSGARAEDILTWWPGRVSFKEEALNKGLVDGLENGLKEWAMANKGKECVAERELAE